MNKKIITGLTATIASIALVAGGAYAAVAHAHDAGTPDCRTHAMARTCWGSTTHIDTDTRKDAWGYTRARFELGLFGSDIRGDTLRNVGLGSSYADTNDDEDISGGHFCLDKGSGGARTYYGTANRASAALMESAESADGLENTDAITYKVNVDTGETTAIEGGEE